MADNRYYYFKDAKGNRHTVDKTAYDKDPMGFAKAFPGARMEVIDRKTGRSGDVDVKDAGRVGDFGAHLFTGRTVGRKEGKVKSEKPHNSALGRAQQSVARQKWGGGVVTQGNTTAYESASAPMENDSELVRGLKNADAVQRLQAPVSYTKPGAVKQMVKQTRERQHIVGQNVEQAGREFTNRERDRRNAPAFDLGNENVNNNLVKTRGQLEDELEESSRQLVDKQLGGYINNSIQKMFKDATVKGVAAEDALSKASPFAYMAAGKAYNEALDPDKLMNQLSKNAEKDMAGLFSDPKMQKEIAEKAASLGIDPEDYVKNYIAPGLQAKIAEEFEKSELSRNMPKSTAEYIIRGVNDSMIGTILSMGMMSKKQRQYAQQGMAMTDNGENPDVKPGMGARVARGTFSFAADTPVFGALGKAGAAVAGKVMGNGVAQAARIANTSLAGRIGRMVGTGAVSQGVTGVLYGSTNAAVQNYSTGDDTSIGNTVKLMTMGGLSEGASWATMGGIGGAVGAGIYNVSGMKRIPAKVFQLAMEGVGMHMGGNVAKMIEGHDTDWLSVEGNLEACANVVALKLTHARLPKRYAKDGKKESYLDMVARNIKNLMTSDGQRAAFGGYTFTNEEKEQLFGSASAPKRKESVYGYDVQDNPLTRKESLTSWAMRAKKTAAKGKGEDSYKDTDAEFVKTAYDEIMADNSIPWNTKAKFSALVMGTVPSARPMMEYIRIEDGSVNEYSKNGELLSKNSFKTSDERDSILYSLNQKCEDQRLNNAYGAAQIKDEKAAQETLETVAKTFGLTAEEMKAVMGKDPLKRSEGEQNACVALRKAYEGEQFPEGTLHPDQSQTEGKDVVEENNLGTENPNNEAVAEVLNNMNNAEKTFNAALESNDVLKQEYERLTKEGLSEPQIYMELFNSGVTQEQLAPFADYINAKAKAVGMYRGTEQKIAETVQKHVEQWSYKGELNGEKQEGGQMLFVKDNNGRLLIVGAGDVAFDSEGRARENVGDMLSVLDPNTKEMDFVSKKDVQLDHVEKTEDYAKNYQEMLEVMNSVAYAESEKVKEKSEKSDTKTESVVTPKEGASAPGVEDVKPIGEGEKKNPSDNGNGSNETLTFADGSPVPMMKDTKGRETADYSQMTPEQGAEWMSSQFGENAEAAVDGQIKRAEKMLKEAEKIKVDYTGDLNDAKEAEAQKAKAVDAAKAELELYTNIKKVMTANKVKAGIEKVGSVGEEGSVGSVGEVSVAVREKFEKSKKIPGRRGSITLPDGTKITGQYFYGEVSGLTPSHDPFNDFKQNEGFPVNEDGSSSNSRSYKDKESRLFTEKIGRDFGGQALKNVPVVQDGILLSGNGTTMGKQLAERYGTDGKYYESLSENAEGFGWTPKQIEEAGFKGTVYFVPDKKMPLTSKTFDLFNRQETKSIGNTEQSVKNAKVLSTDEVGAIIAEIEGSGSLDAFFNNPTAINSLLKRLIDKGVIGLNEVAGLREGEDKLSAAGKDFVKNLLLGSVFSENTIRMMGADAMLKTKALNGIRAVIDNMKLGDYALMKEIDHAMQLMYEAHQDGSGVDAYLRTPAMFGENAADRYDPISQAIALALEGKVEDFRELMMAYNRNAAHYADASQAEMFGERPTKEDFVNEFLKLRNWKDYETRHSSKEGNGDAGSTQGSEPETSGGNEQTEGEGFAKSGNKTLERKNLDDVSTEENGGPLEGDKEGKPENDNGGSPDRDVQARKGQREVDKAVKRESEKGKEKSEESDSKVEGVVTPKGDKKGDIKDATAPKGDKTKEEPSKTNPLAWLAHTAEMFKDEQVQKAKEGLVKAKESGDAEEIKRATADMKQAMETKLRGNGIGLVERRRIIGREIGKILGEEAGKAEAEKIDKPWKDMDGEERMATAEKNPLTEDEIRNNTSEENKSLIEDAVDYVNGNHGIVQQIAYLKIYDDVRNRHENAPDNSGAEDRTQLAAADNGGSQELGVGTGREGGGSSEQLGDGTSGEGRPEQLQHGSQNSTGQPDVPTGEGSHSQGEGEAPGLGGVPAGNTQRERGSNDGSNGATVRHERGRGSGDKTATTNGGRKSTAKQGTHFPDNGTLEQKKQNTAAKKAALKDALKNWAKLGRGELGMNLAGLNSRQIEYLPEVMKAVKDYGVALIDEGIYRVKDWIKSIREAIGEDMKGMKFSDKDIDGFIEEMWNSKYTMNGETHTIGEWADIYGQEKLRKELAGPLTDKAKRQVEVEDVPVKIGDKANIEETLPFLLPQQQEDVLKAETQFFGNEHADREHAYGKGYMFTNGTGTGKTYTGLGIAKRLVKQGKGRILIVTPSQKKVSDWIKDGHNLNMEIRGLDSWAKDRGTTATTESGEGVVITTFANFGVNKKLLETKWDAVIYDESHRIMENKKGTETARSMQHYMVTNRDENHCFLRLQEINKDYQKQKSLGEQFDIERAKETARIRKEYKASHPSATERDVAYATSRMVPRDVYNFTPSDYVTFPVLGKIHAEYVKALSHYTNEVKPKLESQAKTEWKDTKTIFLSATPFNTRENLDYVEGYIFKYPKVENSGRMSGRTQFYLDHFGAGYKFRFNRLEQSTSNPEAVAKQEIAFSDYLQHTLGTMSGRIIDSPYDYSRDFPTVSPDHAERFNQAVQEAIGGHGVLADAYRKTIGDYTYGSALFETMKVANIIERIKAHLGAGRKVVIFHRRVESKEPLKPPFALMLDRANFSISLMNPGEEKNEAIQAVRAFRKKYADLLKWEQTLDYSMPREQIAKVFGKDNVLFFSGKESSKVKDKAVDTFNDDNSGKNIIVIQEASGKEGISLHDKTGEHQRVCITLALPQSPITALQIEGRTYRIGNKSNAIFEYPILGLNSEMMLFGQKFNNQVSTTENLALGSQARSLRDSFANGILEHSGVVPIDQQGVGGKEFDAPKDQSTDGFDNAVLDYYSNQKLNSRNREGVDYFPTPEPLGYKMMEWANMGEGDTVMEPSAGHGAIARYAPKGNQMVAIEPSQSLFAKLQLKAGGLGRKFVNTIFENYDISNKHDVVVMNPPFGTAGATAIAHLGKAFKHLEEGGRVVALIPRGSTDKKFEKWINGEKTAVMRAEVELPDIVFKQAGTKVVCRVVVVDKISNEAMRAKAGRVEKVSLGGHYDKIEDFFEDLRDIEMPDRIIDTNTIMQKKSKQTAKDLKELKDVTVNLNEHGINVYVRGDRNDYSIMFDLGEYNAEQRKSILSGTYERFEEYERYTRDETSQAVIAELKKLTCKLAGMTEEEMQRYLKKKYEGKGVMYRVEHAAEVYNKTKGGSKGLHDGRIVPEDVDKKTSEGIEKKFDEEIGEIEKRITESQRKLFEEQLNEVLEKYSNISRNEILNDLYGKELDVRRFERGGGAGEKGVYMGFDGIRYECAKAAARRELQYRDIRRRTIEDTYGLHPGTSLTFEDIKRAFRRSNRETEKSQLFGQAVSVVKKLGIDFGVGDEAPNGASGVATTDREIALFVDGLSKTSVRHKDDISNAILHEMLHQATMGAIHLVNSGKAEGVLTQKQIDAVNTIIDIYHKVKDDVKRFEEDTYGLQNEYEFAAQMGNSVQRKALDMFETIKAAFRKKGDSDSRNLWQRFKDAVKVIIGGSDKSKMDKAIEDIIDDFNDNVHEMAMDDVRRNDWAMSRGAEGDGVVTPEKTSGTSNAVSERIIKTVEKVAKRTGGKVKMVNSVEEIENPKVRKDIENGKQVTGWYDEKTGEVHLYMPNIHDSYTAEKTVWHETVGHKGMRGLLGDKFNDYMRSLWMDLDNPINAELRAYVKEKMNMNHLGFYDAIEEFIAKSAEDGKGEPGFWNYIKNKVTDALHEIGYRVSPNVKDVKYMLWLAKNVQKHGDSPLWKMRAEAVRWKIEHEKTEYTKIEGGELYDNDGKSHDFENMSREEWLEATDGEIHYRTAPNAATALDRYHHALDRHSYMATEAFMDNMLSLKKLMEAIDPSIRKIEDVNSSMNPYLMQNITEGKMSDKSKLFEIRYMDPLSKAMSSVLDSFDGKKVEDRIRNFNLYMIRKHGLERNRVLFVRDWIREERKGKSEESDSVDALETAWKDERSDLRKKLDSGQIDLKEYYRQMDEWIVQNLDKDFKAEEHDYSGMHGLQGIDDMKSPYDDAGAIDEVMSQEASMESMKKGSVADFWKKVKAATDYSVNSDYESGLISQITHDGVLDMFDWYVPLRKFDEATAEDVYGYVTEMGDPSSYIGTTLMNAKGRKSLSNVEILAQIGLMGNRAIRNGGQNMIKQAFARFVRNSGEQNLVKETKVWVKKTGTDLNGNDIWEEAYPQIPEGASANDVASIVDAFEADMKAKQANGEAKTLSSGTDIGFKFQRAKDKSQHFVDVKIAGRTHRFVVLGNPRAAQALNGMLENGKASRKWLQAVTRWMAMASTSWSPEFVMRNIVRDMEFASSHVAAKEGGRYLAKWSRYYGELNPLNMFYNEGAGSLKSMKMKDFKNGVGYGLYARYREGTLGNSKMERYFKEFMENGGETGFVQLFSMHDMEKSYKSIVEKESAKGAKKVMVNAVEVLKKLGKNVENLNEVAENMARFATYCTSRDLGRSAARSAYDAKEVSTNFNRHGSGDAIYSFKNGEMSSWQEARRNTYGFVSGYLRNYSMFFNAGIQSTNLLFKNIKRAPVGTTVAMTSAPFALALIMAAVNNAIIQNEDDKDRGNDKDPYGKLPDYIRRNNLCIYVGNNRFVTVPLAIELRAFYSLGDLAAGQTFAKNVKSQRNMAMDAVGCMSQLFPVMDFLNNPNYEKSLENGVGMTIEGLAPTAIVPLIEWWLNNDWKGAPIRRTGDKTELNPAWQNAYNNVPARLVDLNKWVNAKTNNIAPGNPEMKGNDALDWITDPSMLNHFYESFSGGMGKFVKRTTGLGAKVATGKTDEIEVGDVPFLRSLFYTPREQSSMARTKAKWYNYKEEMEQTIANNDKLKSKNVPTMKRIENAAALEKFEGSPEQRKVNIIKNAEKRMRHWNTMRKKWADDKKQVDFANKNIEMIMQEAVEDLDKID